jgi:hypothetical protein
MAGAAARSMEAAHKTCIRPPPWRQEHQGAGRTTSADPRARAHDGCHGQAAVGNSAGTNAWSPSSRRVEPVQQRGEGGDLLGGAAELRLGQHRAGGMSITARSCTGSRHRRVGGRRGWWPRPERRSGRGRRGGHPARARTGCGSCLRFTIRHHVTNQTESQNVGAPGALLIPRRWTAAPARETGGDLARPN